MELIRAEIAWSLERNILGEERWLGGRAVKIVDGTGISMPDTPANQALWPQSSEQEAGCGFPAMKLVRALFPRQRSPAGHGDGQQTRT